MTRRNVAEQGIVVDEARAKITSVQEIIIRYRRGKSKKNEGISRWHRKHVAVDDGALVENVTVWVQGFSATPVSWFNQERRSCTWPAITACPSWTVKN